MDGSGAPTRPVVSVVIPTKDRLDLLSQTLRTVLAQDVDLEVVAVDDGSSDGTSDWLTGLGHPRLRVVRHDHPRGAGQARNAGIAVARGRWVAFVDDDDLWLPGKLAAQVAAAERQGAVWAYAGSVTVTSEGRLLRVHEAQPAADRLPWVNVVPGGASNVIARRDALATVGGFDPTIPMVADWDMWIRLQQLGAPAVVAAPLVVYRFHASSMSRNIPVMLQQIGELDERYRHLRGGEPLDWQDVYRWVGGNALMAGDRAAARRVFLAAVRARHVGSVRRLVRASVPIAKRPPLTDPSEAGGIRGRLGRRPLVTWPRGAENFVRDVIGT